MRPTMVDLVSEPPRLLFPDGITVEVPRSVARREALRIVRAGLPPEPAGGGRVAAQPDPHVLLATRVTDVTPPAPVAGENADGGAAVATSDRPSVRKHEGATS